MKKRGVRNALAGPPRLIFATSSSIKAAEVSAMMAGVAEIDHRSVDLLEIQGTAEDIGRFKASEAFRQFRKPVFVEDTSLHLDCLCGLPGPYIKHFSESMTVTHMAQIVKTLGKDGAVARTLIALNLGVRGKIERIHLFSGEVRGKIVEPRGDPKFLWNCIFVPEGQDRTLSEMNIEEKNHISQRSEAVKKFIEYLQGTNLAEAPLTMATQTDIRALEEPSSAQKQNNFQTCTEPKEVPLA